MFSIKCSLKMIVFIVLTIAKCWPSINCISGYYCKEKPIEESIQKADIILAGIVRKLIRNYSSELYSAQIQIHRIIKGHSLVYELFNALSYNYNIREEHKLSLMKSFDKRTLKLVLNGQTIHVNNFGSPLICDSDVRPHDVRVFLLVVDKKMNVYLNSSILRPQLSRTRSLNALIDGLHDSADEQLKCIL
jgi:hypothetical protein